MGKKADAVEILACVLVDRISDQQLVTESVPISQIAEEVLSKLEEDLDAEGYTAAYERGRARGVETSTKGLLTGRARVS